MFNFKHFLQNLYLFLKCSQKIFIHFYHFFVMFNCNSEKNERFITSNCIKILSIKNFTFPRQKKCTIPLFDLKKSGEKRLWPPSIELKNYSKCWTVALISYEYEKNKITRSMQIFVFKQFILVLKIFDFLCHVLLLSRNITDKLSIVMVLKVFRTVCKNLKMMFHIKILLLTIAIFINFLGKCASYNINLNISIWNITYYQN